MDLNIHKKYGFLFKDWEDLKFHTHLYGGRYGGKTFNCNLSIIMQMITKPGIKGIYFRQSLSTVGDSIKSGLQSAVSILNCAEQFQFIGNTLSHINGSQIKFKGVQSARLDDDSKHKGYAESRSK